MGGGVKRRLSAKFTPALFLCTILIKLSLNTIKMLINIDKPISLGYECIRISYGLTTWS